VAGRQHVSLILEPAKPWCGLGRSAVAAVFAVGLAVTPLVLPAGSIARAAAKPALNFGAPYACYSNNPLSSPVEPFTGVAYEPLVWENTKGKFVPGLATKWKIAKGNTSITLTLRQRVRFSDGTAFNAQAVKTMIDWQVATKLLPLAAGSTVSADVLGKYVVRINVSPPSPFLLTDVSQLQNFSLGRTTSPKAVAEIAADSKSSVFSENTYGAGPYVLDPKQSVLNDHCTYVPNKYYYDKSKQKWSKIVFRRLTDDNAILAGLRTLQLDAAEGSTATASAAQAAGLKVVEPKPLGGFLGFVFLDRGGTLNRALKNVRVRQALNYAVDRKSIAKALYGSYGAPTLTPFPGAKGNDPKYAKYYPYDPAKAKKLLAAAGYKNGFSMKAFTFVPSPATQIDVLAQEVKAEWAAIGVNVDLQIPTNFTQLTPLYSGKQEDGLFTNGYAASDSPLLQWPKYMLPGGFYADQHGWDDPVLDKLYNKALRSRGKAELALERQMITRCITQAYFVPVSAYGTLLFVNPKRVTGVVRPNEFSEQIVDWSPAHK
jgi:peptide/nickel transport system substrate-binding protein